MMRKCLFSPTLGRGIWALLGAAILVAAPVRADEEEDTGAAKRTDAEPAAAAAVRPFTYAPWSDERKGQIQASGFYDDARQRTISEARADVRLIGPISLHGGAQTAMRDAYVSPIAGAQVNLLAQGRHFVDGAFSMTYRGEGFNLVRALEMRAAFGRRFGDTALYLNLAYVQGLEQNERYVDGRFSAMQGLFERHVFVGFDSRVRVDAEIDNDEPAREPEMDVMAGPTATFALGGVAVTGFGGVSAVRYRDKSPSHSGLFAGLSIGSVFF